MSEKTRSKTYQRQVFFGRLDFFLPIFRFFPFFFLFSFIEGEVFEKVLPWTKKFPFEGKERKRKVQKDNFKNLKTSYCFKRYNLDFSKNGYTYCPWTNSMDKIKCTYILFINKYIYLTSDESSFITGTEFVIDDCLASYRFCIRLLS